jgi:TPR repeat protein
MPIKIILALMLRMLVLPAFAQNEPPQSTTRGDADELDIPSLRIRAEGGEAEAQYLLGVMYFTGRSLPQDYKEAYRWARPAADQGEARAQFVLGLMYEAGQAVPQDYMQAHIWYNLAAASLTGGNRESAAGNRDRVAITMTAENIAEAQRLAREWKPKKKE